MKGESSLSYKNSEITQTDSIPCKKRYNLSVAYKRRYHFNIHLQFVGSAGILFCIWAYLCAGYPKN